MKKIIVLSLCVSMGCSADGRTDGTGEMGAMGVPGPQGPAGPAGAVGPQGAQGNQGIQGSQGAPGAAGAAGAKGDKGDVGNTGSAGAPGAQGAQGSPGAQGAQGAQGLPGTPGAAGAAGARGPAAYVYSSNNVKLGLLLSATPGSEAYVSYGDGYTLLPDGLIVPMVHNNQKVWYTNNDCTGIPYIVEGFGWVPNANYTYIGYFNAMYTAATAVASNNLAVQSYSSGGATCIVQSIATKVHAVTSVGSPIDPAGSMPWHIVIQ